MYYSGKFSKGEISHNSVVEIIKLVDCPIVKILDGNEIFQSTIKIITEHTFRFSLKFRMKSSTFCVLFSKKSSAMICCRSDREIRMIDIPGRRVSVAYL